MTTPTVNDVKELLKHPPNSSKNSLLPPPGKLYEGRRIVTLSDHPTVDERLQKLDDRLKDAIKTCEESQKILDTRKNARVEIPEEFQKKHDQTSHDSEVKPLVPYIPLNLAELVPFTPSPMPVPPSEKAAVDESLPKPSRWSQISSILWKVLIVVAIVALIVLLILPFVL